MYREALQIIKPIFLSLILGSGLVGCSLFDVKPGGRGSLDAAPNQRVLFASYDSVWAAANAVIRYPIAGIDQDRGTLETEMIRAVEGWLAPEITKKPSLGIRYKIIMTFAKGRIEGRESTRVTIEKKIEKQKDFFSEPEPLESDGLEEKVMFYRIERELIIKEALKRAALTP